jgi:hypothetical protein
MHFNKFYFFTFEWSFLKSHTFAFTLKPPPLWWRGSEITLTSKFFEFRSKILAEIKCNYFEILTFSFHHKFTVEPMGTCTEQKSNQNMTHYYAQWDLKCCSSYAAQNFPVQRVRIFCFQ